MTQTDRLNLPLIQSNQAQKHITHNEALRILDAFLHLTLEGLGINDPPETPVIGQNWQIGETPNGDWAPHGGKIASYDINGWQFLDPKVGMLAWVKTAQELYVFGTSGWVRFDQPPTQMQNASQIGVGTNADPYNRLAIKSEGAFLSNPDVGSGDARFTLNKASAGNTTSISFKNAWSGRAEIGLAGSDELAVKVSENGANWTTAATFNPSNGELSLLAGLSHLSKGVTQKVNSISDCGRFAAEKTRQISNFVPPAYLTMENGAILSEFSKFQVDSTDYGGANPANNMIVKQLVDQIREPTAARYLSEFYVAKLLAGAGVAYENTQSGNSKYRLCSYGRVGGARQSFGAYFYVLSGTALISEVNHDVWLNGVKLATFAQILPSDGWQHINAIADTALRYATHQEGEIFPLFATSGVEILLALPAIIMDAVRIGPDDGLIPSHQMAE